jgi:hypothetical protein
MKKLMIFLLITIFLFSINTFTCLAKTKDTWDLMSHTDKLVYLMGVYQTIEMFVSQMANYGPTQYKSTNKNNETIFTAFLEDTVYIVTWVRKTKSEPNEVINRLETFIDIISDLYKDPANSYIPAPNLLLVASRKIRGEPFDSLLNDLRKKSSQ